MVWITTMHRLTILLLGPIALGLSVGCASDQESAPARGFYAEIAVEVEAQPGDPLARFGGGNSRTAIRWWYAPDPARWRWEFETVGTGIDDGIVLMVADGNDLWEYDNRTDVYRRVVGRYASLGSEAMAVPAFGVLVGPVRADSVDALMAQWRERGDDPEVTMAGETTLLGRLTEIVELRAPAGGGERAFVDQERMFIMRWEVDGADGGESYRAEVVRLDYGAEIDAARFAFEPPSGARKADASPATSCSGGSGPIGGASFPAEPGFLAPTYTPPGYRSAGAGAESGAGSCDPVAVWVLLEAADGSAITLRQRFRPGGMPALDRSWRPVASDLNEAYRQSENGILSVLWRAGDIVALLQTDAVSFDDLIRMAESASLVPSRTR